MGGIFSPATLEQIRAASDIVDVIGGYLPLKRAGANFIALCPFHKEKTPSFNVNPHKQIFHCFGCHKGGDVFTFVKDYENIDFPAAVRRLAERAHIVIELDSHDGAPKSGASRSDCSKSMSKSPSDGSPLWRPATPAQWRAITWRAAVSPAKPCNSSASAAPEAWDDTVNWAKSKHFELPLIEQAGLILRKEGADHYYDRFRGRLIFPICDEQGRVVGFSGRVLSGDEKTAKYVNSPETPIFTKGKLFFGLDKSKRALLDSRRAVVCEGQLDLIACFMSGVKNIVAPQGTALTADHVRILKRYVDEVVLCFDSDNAGQNAAVRSLESLLASFTGQSSAPEWVNLLSSGLAIRVATVPSPHDPDSFIKEFGGAAFAQLIDNARGFFDFYLDRLCALNDTTSDRGRRVIARGMAEAARKTGSNVLRDTYAQKTALRLGVAMEAMRQEFSRVSPAPTSEPDDSTELETQAPPLSKQEGWLLRLLLESDAHVQWVAAHLDLEWVPNPVAREIVARRLQAPGQWPGVAAWLAQLENPQWQSLVTECLTDSRSAPAEANLKGSPTHAGLIRRLRDDYLNANSPPSASA